jgi:hypothetical protein
MNLKQNEIVFFDPKVYAAPYAPHYNRYRNHAFKIVAFHEYDHIELECISDPTVKVNGYVHEDELISDAQMGKNLLLNLASQLAAIKAEHPTWTDEQANEHLQLEETDKLSKMIDEEFAKMSSSELAELEASMDRVGIK